MDNKIIESFLLPPMPSDLLRELKENGYIDKDYLANSIDTYKIHLDLFETKDLNDLEALVKELLKNNKHDYSQEAKDLLDFYEFLLLNPTENIKKDVKLNEDFYKEKYYYYKLRLFAIKFWSLAITDEHKDYLLFFEQWVDQVNRAAKEGANSSIENVYDFPSMGLLDANQVDILRAAIYSLSETVYESILSHFLNLNVVQYDHKGVPYILVYIPLSSDFAAKIKEAFGVLNGEEEEHIKISFPVISRCYFTYKDLLTDRLYAENNSIENYFLVKWVPVKNILFSGPILKTIFPLQTSKVKSTNILFQGDQSLTVHPKYLKVFNSEDSLSNIKFKKDENVFLFDNELLQKNSKNKVAKILSAGMAAAIIGTHGLLNNLKTKNLSPQAPSVEVKKEGPVEPQIKIKNLGFSSIQEKYKNNINTHKQILEKMPPFLQVISQIESSGGQNVNHPTVKKGLNAETKAIGIYGIMPMQALEIIKKDKNLQKDHGHLLKLDHKKDQLKIHDYLADNPVLEHQLALSHSKRLEKIFGKNEEKMAHAWFRGISGTINKTDEEILSEPYVQKFIKYKQQLLESKPNKHIAFTKLNKKEDDDIQQQIIENLLQNTTFNHFLLNKEASLLTPKEELEVNKIIQGINKSLQEGRSYIFDYNNKKHLIVGSSVNDLWIFKFNIKSTDTLYNINYDVNGIYREHYFNLIARRVFNLGDNVPQTFIGTLTDKNNENAVEVICIKYYTGNFSPAFDLDSKNDIQYWSTMKKLLDLGVIHQLAFLLLVLSDYDSHANNVLVDPTKAKIVLIDHEFGFDSDDINVDKYQLPYILRCFKHASVYNFDEIAFDKYKLPLVQSPYILKKIKDWIAQINKAQIVEFLNILNINSDVILKKIERAQAKILLENLRPDLVINEEWHNEINSTMGEPNGTKKEV